MANLTFHGVGGDYRSVSKEAHEELLACLADNRSTCWTDTFINIMKYVQEQQKRGTENRDGAAYGSGILRGAARTALACLHLGRQRFACPSAKSVLT